MSASKDTKRGTWKVYIRYIDWMGNKQIKTKRGFQTKKEALAWERDFLQSQSKDMNMSFKAFAEIYMNDMKPRIRESTMENKRYIIDRRESHPLSIGARMMVRVSEWTCKRQFGWYRRSISFCPMCGTKAVFLFPFGPGTVKTVICRSNILYFWRKPK